MKKQKFLRFCRMSCLLVCKRSAHARRPRSGSASSVPRRALCGSVFGLAGAAAPCANTRALCGCKSRPPEVKRSFLPLQEILRLRCAPLRMTESGRSGGWERELRGSVFGLAGAAAPCANTRALCGCKSRPPEVKRSFLPLQEILRLRCAPLRMTESGRFFRRTGRGGRNAESGISGFGEGRGRGGYRIQNVKCRIRDFRGMEGKGMQDQGFPQEGSGIKRTGRPPCGGRPVFIIGGCVFTLCRRASCSRRGGPCSLLRSLRRVFPPRRAASSSKSCSGSRRG